MCRMDWNNFSATHAVNGASNKTIYSDTQIYVNGCRRMKSKKDMLIDKGTLHACYLQAWISRDKNRVPKTDRKDSAPSMCKENLCACMHTPASKNLIIIIFFYNILYMCVSLYIYIWKDVNVLTGTETIRGYKFFSAKYVTWCGVPPSGI